jgi:hypothetical protein
MTFIASGGGGAACVEPQLFPFSPWSDAAQRCALGGGYVFSTSPHTRYGVPPANILAMADALFEHGRCSRCPKTGPATNP